LSLGQRNVSLFSFLSIKKKFSEFLFPAVDDGAKILHEVDRDLALIPIVTVLIPAGIQ
jgi:hypothetical protein